MPNTKTLQRELFIYFRARAVDEGRVRDAVHAMHQQISRELPAVSSRLLRRPDASQDGLHTWMEIYANDKGNDAGITADIQAAVEQAAQVLTPLLVGQRHVEVFESLVS